jgi:hypothetical protein
LCPAAERRVRHLGAVSSQKLVNPRTPSAAAAPVRTVRRRARARRSARRSVPARATSPPRCTGLPCAGSPHHHARSVAHSAPPPSAGALPLRRSWSTPESSWLPPDGVLRRRREAPCLVFRSSRSVTRPSVWKWLHDPEIEWLHEAENPPQPTLQVAP